MRLTLGIKAGRFWSTNKMSAGADILNRLRTFKPSAGKSVGAGPVIANLVAGPPIYSKKVWT